MCRVWRHRNLLIMDDMGPLCLTCADMDHLAFLPSGDAALTRRAKKASHLSAVVVRWSRARKRYERQGLLVEEAALEQAEQECLADENARMRRRERDAGAPGRPGSGIAGPSCYRDRPVVSRLPAGRAEAIARHASLRGSGRVGRSAAGRSLDEKAVTLALVASVRHEDTEYDSLLMAGVPREAARDRVRPDIDRVLNGWASAARLAPSLVRTHASQDSAWRVPGTRYDLVPWPTLIHSTPPSRGSTTTCSTARTISPSTGKSRRSCSPWSPSRADVMRENRQFLARATRWAAGQGVTQFIDLGCGMPTEPNTHGSAGTVIAASRASRTSTTTRWFSRTCAPSRPTATPA